MRQIIVKYGNIEKQELASDYAHKGLKIALCAKPKDYKVKVLTSFESCRETFTYRLCQAFSNPKDSNTFGLRGNLTEVDKNRLRFLICLKIPLTNKTEASVKKFKAGIDENLQTSLKLLNHYEKRHGWGITKLYETNNSGQFMVGKRDKNDYVCVYMVVSSKKWMTSPATASLHTLMLRLGSSGFKGEFDTHEKLMEELHKFGKKSGINRDNWYVKKTYEKWDVLLGNLNRIYRGRTPKNIYSGKSLSNGGDGGSVEGVYQLCIGRSADIIAAGKFKKVCEEHGLKQDAVMEKMLKERGELESEIARLGRRRA